MNKSTVIAIVIITVCLSTTLGLEIDVYNENELGLDECAVGLSYWCQNLQTAKRCQAVNECILMAWENKKFPPDNSEVCATCVVMVQETRDELRNDTTQELVKDMLDEACNMYFNTDVIVKECLQQVSRFIIELHAIFSSRMDSQSVCSVTLFCNSETINQLIVDYNNVADESSVSDTCQDCKVFAVDAVATTKTMTRSVFKQKLVSLCNKLRNKYVRKGCVQGALRNANNLYNYITTQATPDQFCSSAIMCVDDDKGQFRTSQPDDPGCDLCLEIVTVLHEALTQKEFKSDLFNALLGMCSWIGSYKQQCENDLKEYFDVVYEILIDQLDPPKKVCQIIGVCPSDEKFDDEDDEDDMEKNVLSEINIDDTSNEMISWETLGNSLDFPESYEAPVDVSETCQHCQTFAIDAVAVTKKLGKNAFKGKLLNICMGFHVKKILCKLAVNMNGDKIYNDITTKMTPQNFCRFTTMCDNIVDVKNAAVDDFQCLICQRFMTEIRDFLTLKATKNAIHNVFLALCSILGPLEQQCADIMNDKYFGIIFKFVILAMEPKPICHLVDFCDGAAHSHLDSSDAGEPLYEFPLEDAYNGQNNIDW